MDRTGENDQIRQEKLYGSGEFDRNRTGEDDLRGQEKLILQQNKKIFWQQMSHFYSCEDNCYQNWKVIVTKNLRGNYHSTMDEK